MFRLDVDQVFSASFGHRVFSARFKTRLTRRVFSAGRSHRPPLAGKPNHLDEKLTEVSPTEILRANFDPLALERS